MPISTLKDILDLAGGIGHEGVDDQSSSNDDQLTIKDSELVINEDGDDLDFRVEASGVANALVVQGSDGNIGVGTLTPDAQLEITKASANAEVMVSCYHDTEATTPKLTLRKADGSEASPALVDDNAVLGTISFQGHDGSGFEQGAKIEARVNGTPSDGTDMPTELSLWTTPDGSNTAVQRMTVLANGNVGIGEAAPADKLDIDGSLFVRGDNIWLKGQGDDTAPRLRLHHSGSNAYVDWETGDLYFRNDNTDRVVLTSGGNIKVSTAGAGIDFSTQASPAAGMTDELLDRYEEGTWTPRFYNLTDDSAITATYYGEVVGYYTRIGRQVTLTCYLRTMAMTAPDSSKRIAISGIPFNASLSETTNHPHIRSLVLASAWSTDPVAMSIMQNESFIRLFTSRDASWINEDPITGDHLYDGTHSYKNQISFAITYHI